MASTGQLAGRIIRALNRPAMEHRVLFRTVRQPRQPAGPLFAITSITQVPQIVKAFEERFGKAVQVTMPRFPSGAYRHFFFVDFVSAEAARAAIEACRQEPDSVISVDVAPSPASGPSGFDRARPSLAAAVHGTPPSEDAATKPSRMFFTLERTDLADGKDPRSGTHKATRRNSKALQDAWAEWGGFAPDTQGSDPEPAR